MSETKTANTTIIVVSAAIERDGAYLITQRNTHAVLPLLWEFPGGRVHNNESNAEALSRQLRHRVGVDVRVLEEISSTHKKYTDYTVKLILYRCELAAGTATPKNVNDLLWVRSTDFEQFEFTPADESSMNALLADDP